jgi:hypothetical protein
VEDVAELEALLKRGSLSPADGAKVQKLMARHADRARARTAAAAAAAAAAGSHNGSPHEPDRCSDRSSDRSSAASDPSSCGAWHEPLAEHDLVVLEVVEAEKRYVAALQQLGGVAAALSEAPALLSPDDHKCLFSNLAQVRRERGHAVAALRRAKEREGKKVRVLQGNSMRRVSTIVSMAAAAHAPGVFRDTRV